MHLKMVGLDYLYNRFFWFSINTMESQFGCHNSLDIDSNDNLHVSYTNYNVDVAL